MKPRKVKRLDPDAPLVEAAGRILTVRLDEVESFASDVTDPANERALHDMRIALKRLRYVLEVTRPCFGEMADDAIASAKRFQDVLGEIHDCDEMLPRLAALEGEGLDVLADHLRLRRAERFARFRVLWPDVDDAATSCSRVEGSPPIASD